MIRNISTFGDVERLGSAAVVSMLGAALAVPTIGRIVTGGETLPGLALAGLGTVLALVLVAAGVLLAWAEFTPHHTLRISGWAILGTIVLGLVLALIALSGVDLPVYAGATLLSVSAFAHVLIGVRDVQRIRAEDVARQREKLAVLNRLARHNLRHEAQLLVFAAGRLPDATDRPTREDVAADVEAVAADLTEMNETLGQSQELIRSDTAPSTVDLSDLVAGAVADVREDHPDAAVEVSVPDGCRVVAGDQLQRAVAELIENAVQHAGDAPDVRVQADRDRGRVTLRVVDDGPGIPEEERAVVTREVDIDQLAHSQGLGLWFVRWVMDAYGGEFGIEATDEGTVVSIGLPAARG